MVKTSGPVSCIFIYCDSISCVSALHLSLGLPSLSFPTLEVRYMTYVVMRLLSKQSVATQLGS
jgi:hypothetical protein